MANVYSSYDAKTKFSEIMKKVMSGQRIGIQYYGKIVAEIIPFEEKPKSTQERISEMEKEGSLIKATSNKFPALIADVPAVLERFLETRDE